VKPSPHEDLEASALEVAVGTLQAEKVTTRCNRVVVDRLADLTEEQRGEVQLILRTFEVPGFRRGRAPFNAVLSFTQQHPRLDRWLFRRMFRFWVEIFAGLPEEAAAVAASALPELDLAKAEWATIVSAAPLITTRMPRRSSPDVLLALFQCRFGSVIARLLNGDTTPDGETIEDDGAEHPDAEHPDAEHPDAEHPAAEHPAAEHPGAEQHGAEQHGAAQHGGVTPSPSEDAGNSGSRSISTSADRIGGSESETVETLASLIKHLRAAPSSSAIWDGLVPGFIGQVEELRSQKIEERSSLTARNAIAAALATLQSPEYLQELGFLHVQEECESWHPHGSSLIGVAVASEQLNSLVEAVKAHRDARLGARHSRDDDELERHTTERQRAKRLILSLVADLGPALRRVEAPSATEGERAAPAELEANTSSELRLTSERAGVTADASSSMSGEAGDAVAPATRLPSIPDSLAVPEQSVSDTDTSDREEPADTRIPLSPPSGPAFATQPPPVPPPATIAMPIATTPSIKSGATTDHSVSSLLEIPEEITAYARFREHFWLGTTGVETAPWRGPLFVDALAGAMSAWLAKGPSRTWALLTVSRALEALGQVPLIATSEIRSAASLWWSPESASAGLDRERSERLRSGEIVFGTPGQRVALVLEALRPSADRPLLAHELSVLLDQAQFAAGALRGVVTWLLTTRAYGHDPLELLRRSHRTSARDSRDLSNQLDAARRDLQTLVTRVWSAAGGKVQRTHCRHAWSDFVERVQPSLTRLYPPPRGNDRWTPVTAAQEVDGYLAKLDSACERFGAKFDDKRRMVRTATEIADAARKVIDLRRSLQNVDDDERPPRTIPNLEIDQLRANTCSAVEEEFGRQLLVRALGGNSTTAATHPLAITIVELCNWPNLLRVIRDVPRESVDALRHPEQAFAYADDLNEPIRAAAILVQPAEPSEGATIDALISRLERTQRIALLGQFVNALDDRLQRQVHAERTESLGRLSASLSQISQIVDDLTQLGNPFASSFRAVRDHVRTLVETDDIRLDTTLMERWLERLLDHGRQLVDNHVLELSTEAERRDEREDIQAALTRRDYLRAIRLLRGHAGTELRTTRQTEWRDVAEANREAQLRTLYASTDPKLKALLGAWRAGVKGDPTRRDRTLRTEFARVLTDGRDMSRDSAPAYLAFPMSAVQDQLARDQLMPTWMPQLSRFGRLVLLTPPVSPEQPSFRAATLSHAATFSQDFVVFLTPRLSSVRRSEFLSEIRRRGNAAVVDDVDLLRLLNPGGQRPHQLLGLLEIALEQQRRSVFSPFDLPEGSLVRLEMYVGRKDKARELARTANYSRLFSGRKLGKSALLRFMERTEGGVKLPSGNVLRVVYVPAAGIESEIAMVDAIHTSLETTLGEKLPPPNVREPSDRLGQLLNEYLTKHRLDSLLLVLDEADVFFERQLAEYADQREKCLSFQMRSRFTAAADEHGLPRVRFVFAGYRVTNRSQGAWSNWGRVLSLDPLEPDDATRLIAAPLAVMGIDLGSHAHEVAYRCGYQPAILLRFGERLMDHLDRQPYRPADRYIVTKADLSQVLDDQRVHEEIRTIARGNFEGNPAGLIVFGALLREILELPPGQPLRDAPQRLVERLRAIDPDLSWLERESDSTEAVRGFLSEFVERNLLRDRRVGGAPSYALRFPHHLTILSELADVSKLREEIKHLRARTTGSSFDNVERALIPARALRDLAEAAQPRSDAIAVVGTLWPTGTYDRSGGIPDRLGATSDETVDAQVILDDQRNAATARVIRRVDAVSAEYLLAELRVATARPVLIGGIDLYRWALQQRRSSTDVLFEVHGVGRLSPARLTWWFQRNRAFEFVRSDAIATIYQRTAGIPFLVELVDGQLQAAAGSTLSEERVTLALDAVDEAMPNLARDLVAGRPAIKLEHREREILQMIAHVVSVDPTAGQDLGSALTELWELFSERCEIAPLASNDGVAIEVLLDLGVLPAKGPATGEPHTRIGAVDASDPILKLVRMFGERVESKPH